MTKVKLRDIIILTVLIIFLVNYAFNRYVYSSLTNKKEQIISEIKDTDSRTSTNIQQFYSDIKIFSQILNLEDNIQSAKIDIAKIKKEIKTTEKVSDILKTLILSTNLKVNEVSVSNVSFNEDQIIQTFNVQATGKMKSILELMENIESRGNIMSIKNYSLSFQDDEINFKSVVSAVVSK